MFKVNGWPPSRVSAMATRRQSHPAMTGRFTINGRCTSTPNNAGGSNPAPYIHSTRQTYTRQDKTGEQVKNAGDTLTSLTKNKDKRRPSVLPMKATEMD